MSWFGRCYCYCCLMLKNRLELGFASFYWTVVATAWYVEFFYHGSGF